MYVVRPVTMKDLNQLYRLSALAKSGLTTLPHSKSILTRRIKKSLESFKRDPHKPAGETYFFVMEDMQKKKVIGTCAIISKVGGFQPFYTYKIKTARKVSKRLKVNKKIQYLELVKDYNGPTEIGTLFIVPDYRKEGLGRFLSLSRFLFMAQHPKAFEADVIAEMRGVFDEDDRSPFWEEVGRHFFDVEFKKADLMAMDDKSFIEELMPRHPVYIPLLAREVQDVIGQVHPYTKPALHMLESEGFKIKDEVDIFEAGPVVSAKLKKIRTVKESRKGVVKRIGDSALFKNRALSPILIANCKAPQHFRATLDNLLKLPGGKVQITSKTARAISVKEGDPVVYVTLKSK